MEFIILIVLFLTFSALVAYFGSAGHKGKRGEAIVNRYARRLLDPDEYHLIEDVTLETRNGTTQIDHIVISIYGIFVIETKNLSGWIFGNERQRTWTQVIYKNKYKFQNPLRQNYAHVKTLQSLLKLKNNQIHSVVAFVGDCLFKTDMPENVTYGKEFIYHIKSMLVPVLTELEVEKVINTINDKRLERSTKTDRAHVRNLRNN